MKGVDGKPLGLGNMPSSMSKQQKDAVERNFEAKAEKHFKSHRELPPGRNVWAWNREHQPEADRKYKENFDRIFPNAPGAGF